MKHTVILTILSVLSIIFMTLHVSDDMARGLDSAGPVNIFGVLILGVWLYGALLLPGRRSGYIILLLGSVFGLGVTILHMNGARFSEIVRSSGGFFFFFTLYAIGTTALLSLVLSVRGLWSLRRGQPR